MPVFEGLLPEPHNQIVLDLLFGLAEWHAEAKLCMHTDSSLQLLTKATLYLGSQMCCFTKTTCNSFNTKELSQETAACGRQQHKKNTTITIQQAQSAMMQSATSMKPVKASAIQKKFSLETYKLHTLGDYVRQIHLFGPTDLYSTQTVSSTSIKSAVAMAILTDASQGELEH